MTNSTRNLLRLISVLVALALVLMELGFLAELVNFRFWFMVGAYAMLLFTLRK